jgi:hypothetical protein
VIAVAELVDRDVALVVQRNLLRTVASWVIAAAAVRQRNLLGTVVSWVIAAAVLEARQNMLMAVVRQMGFGRLAVAWVTAVVDIAVDIAVVVAVAVAAAAAVVSVMVVQSVAPETLAVAFLETVEAVRAVPAPAPAPAPASVVPVAFADDCHT